jgi:hypothetical protein
MTPLDKAREALAAVEKATDAARKIASYSDGHARRNVYLAAIGVVGPLLAERERLADRVAKLEAGLKHLYRGYVGTLEAGRDRIMDFGGTCDPVDVMEEGDPYLRAARALITPAVTEAQSEALHNALVASFDSFKQPVILTPAEGADDGR